MGGANKRWAYSDLVNNKIQKTEEGMSGQTAEVKNYSSQEKLGVKLPHPCTSSQAKAAIGKKLGIKPSSISLFGLFLGPLGRPSKVLKNAEEVPLGGDFSFHRWSFDLAKEEKLCLKDDVATSLLFCEAKHYYQNGTKIKPTPAQVEELESFMDPDFPVERQYMQVMRSIPGYSKYIVHECTVKEDIKTNACTISKGAQIQCHLDADCLTFTNDAEEPLIEWQWRIVRRWKMDKVNTIMFEVFLEELNASIMKWVSLETRQSNYLFNLASEICDIKRATQDKLDNPLPAINPALAGRVQDPLRDFVNGIFTGFAFSGPFSSIES